MLRCAGTGTTSVQSSTQACCICYGHVLESLAVKYSNKGCTPGPNMHSCLPPSKESGRTSKGQHSSSQFTAAMLADVWSTSPMLLMH